MSLSSFDLLIVVSYFVVLLALGLMFARKKTGGEDYLLSARQLSLPAFVMTIVTTWYGAILGVGEFIFSFGVVGWVVNGLVWYIIYLFFALYLARKIHDSFHVTVADQIRSAAGTISGGIAALFTYIMTTPAPYILSLGVLLNAVFGVPLFWAVAAGAAISGLYIWWGGFRAVVRTDIIQFIFMYLGFGLLLIMAMMNFGGFDFLTDNLPATHFTFSGTLGIGPILIWGLLAFWTLVDPNFYQRCFAAKDGATAKKGVLIATGFWLVFDMLTLTTGLYAAAAFPLSDPLFSYLTLADAVLPMIAKGLFVVTLLSIIMSTIDSFLFASSSIVANDYLKRKHPSGSMVKLTRIGIVITLVLSLFFAWAFQSIIGIIYGVGTVGVSALLLPILLSFFSKRKLADTVVALSMIAAAGAATIWLAIGWLNAESGWPVYPWTLEPMYVGLLASLLVLAIRRNKLTT